MSESHSVDSVHTEDELWAVPASQGALNSEVRLPGSKSITNRAYVLAALAYEPTLVRAPLDSRDSRLMLAALRTLGASYELGDAGVRIHPIPARTEPAGQRAVDLGNAGTVARFTPALAALGTATVRFDGDEAIRRRPISPLLNALTTLGVRIDDGGRGAPPFTVTGTGSIAGGTVPLDSSASSQFLSALLLVAPRCDDGLTVRLVGGEPPSEPHIAMTMQTLRAFGAQAHRDGVEFHVGPARMRNPDFVVEPDLSTAAPFAVAPLVTGGTARIAGWPHATTQPGDQLRDLLRTLGAELRLDDDGLRITGSGRLPGADLDLHEVGELTPVMAALLCFADGPSRISGVAHLRGHETDRLAALATQLSALGPKVSETPDGLHIEPAPLRAGTFDTYDDHRLVMAGAVLGLGGSGIRVRNPDTVGKTFPGFRHEWERFLGASVL